MPSTHYACHPLTAAVVRSGRDGSTPPSCAGTRVAIHPQLKPPVPRVDEPIGVVCCESCDMHQRLDCHCSLQRGRMHLPARLVVGKQPLEGRPRRARHNVPCSCELVADAAKWCMCSSAPSARRSLNMTVIAFKSLHWRSRKEQAPATVQWPSSQRHKRRPYDDTIEATLPMMEALLRMKTRSTDNNRVSRQLHHTCGTC